MRLKMPNFTLHPTVRWQLRRSRNTRSRRVASRSRCCPERGPAGQAGKTRWRPAPGEALHSAQQTVLASSGELEAWVSNLSCRGRLIWDDRFRDYDFGPQHPLRPERFAHGLDLLREGDLWRPDSETLQPLTASRQELELVHSP